MQRKRPAFVAYPNRRNMVVVIAAMAPLVAVTLAALVVHPAAPMILRVVGTAVIAPVVAWIVICLRLALQRRPVLVIDAAGVAWSRWSDRPVPWSAVERWQRRHYINSDYVTVWLKDPDAHRPGLPQWLLSWANQKLGFGHLTLSGGGLDQGFAEMARAFADFAPKPPLPDDPRLARRLAAARARNDG